ncbi:MAG: circularly permuted type 2 ATP-grasp protein [Magnetococcales bacterium]|nr:circularly permuted type 2 ATP-grasp protein [Magnetococcales bacterium]
MGGSNASFDEMHGRGSKIRPSYQEYAKWLHSLSVETLEQRNKQADLIFRRLGITFNVYGADGGVERLIPFDVVPRILSRSEWDFLARGVRQRVTALNAFLRDIYNGQEILRAGILPEEMVLSNSAFIPELLGLTPARGIYAHVSGIDLVRVDEETFYVLEDNVRVPSGVSYMLENRQVMMRLFPDLFSRMRVAPVSHYPELLLQTLRSAAPRGVQSPRVVVLTPGQFNSAYFEHAFLAQEMGIDLVEGQDLFVEDGKVYMRTTKGPRQVDVIYRRVDDEFIDPLVFKSGSLLGVPGLLTAYRLGTVSFCNGLGNGIADDKAIYAYVPEFIRFYLGEKPILKNAPTYQLRNRKDRDFVLKNLKELVVKEVHGSGGYGMLVGPAATQKELETFRDKIKARPENFIAQPTLALSTCPTFVAQGIAPRHVDLRPYVLCGERVEVVPGGLTRVALTEGSLVVNSSQGGGTKDTWILEDDHAQPGC